MGTSFEQMLDQRRRISTVHKPVDACSASSAIREMQMKTTMQYHLTLIRMAIRNKMDNNKRW